MYISIIMYNLYVNIYIFNKERERVEFILGCFLLSNI